MNTVLLGLVNGLCISLSRVLNSRLSVATGTLLGSVINHVGALVVLVALATYQEGMAFQALGEQFPTIPASAFLGGIIGAVFVASQSWVSWRIGLAGAVLLLVSGQLMTAVIIDQLSQQRPPRMLDAVGIALIVLGSGLLRTLWRSSKSGSAA